MESFPKCEVIPWVIEIISGHHNMIFANLLSYGHLSFSPSAFSCCRKSNSKPQVTEAKSQAKLWEGIEL